MGERESVSSNDSTDRSSVSKLSRRGLLALGATVAGTTGLSLFSNTSAAASHDLTAFRDAFIGNAEDRQGLGSLGWLFFAKDTGTLYYHDGSSWVDLGIDGGNLSDTDSDGLLEAPDHNGLDIGQLQAGSVSADEVSGIIYGNHRDVQTVVDSASAGDTIIFDLSYKHVLSSALTINVADLTIHGLNAKLTDSTDANIVHITASGVTFQDYRLDGNKANQTKENSCINVTGDEVTVTDGKTVDASRHGILIQASGATQEAVTIKDNIHRNPKKCGVSVEGAASYEIIGTTVRGEDVFSPGKSGVEVNDNAAHTTLEECYARNAVDGVVAYTDHGDNGCRDTTISACHADGCGQIVHGNTIDSSLTHKNLTIENCSGENLTSGNAISVTGIDEGLKISGSTIEGPANRGIDIGDCPRATLKDNTIHGFPNNFGIFVVNSPGVSIDDNVLKDGKNGIRVEETNGESLEDWSIDKNRVTGVTHAIVVREGTSGTVDYYHVGDNRVRGNTTAADFGAATGRNEVVVDNIPTL